MKKFTIVALVLVLCLGALGVGYAAWKDQVNINGTVQTGSVNLNVEAYSGTDVYKILTTDELVRFNWKGDRPSAPPDSELVAYAIAEPSDDDVVQLTFSNLFPLEEGFVADWLMHYVGTVPAKLMVDTEITGIPEDWVKIETMGDGQPVELEGLQLHYCDYVAVYVTIVVPQIPESMDVSGTITMTITAIQWNEYCTFTTIAQPGDGTYLADTTKIDISGIADLTSLSSISDGTLTVDFATAMEKRTVGVSWATWASPPYTETDTPPVLYTSGYGSQTLYLSAPCKIFGFELEPNPYTDVNYQVDFIFSSGGTVIGSISMTVNGSYGARLFAGQATGGCSFDQIDIVGDFADFAIAQVRYGLD